MLAEAVIPGDVWEISVGSGDTVPRSPALTAGEAVRAGNDGRGGVGVFRLLQDAPATQAQEIPWVQDWHSTRFRLCHPANRQHRVAQPTLMA